MTGGWDQTGSTGELQEERCELSYQVPEESSKGHVSGNGLKRPDEEAVVDQDEEKMKKAGA
ncbi:hypothetical protein MC885_008134 [Smutsia gigantea]|nr:hypothetical protein MC885_008134 [Smutsia gigantea]